MIQELSLFCEQHGLSAAITYAASEEVWDIDIDDKGFLVYSSFIFKESLPILLQNACNATIEYIKKHNVVQDTK